MECSVCMEAFDHEARRPKVLPCGHTLCLKCLQNPTLNNLCPQDRKAFEGDPMTLPDNFALLAAEARAEGVWCEFCRRQYGAECADAGHRPYSQRQRQAAQVQLGVGVAELRREFEELRLWVQKLAPSVAELRQELQETQRQMQVLQPSGPSRTLLQPAPRLELDVKELSSTAERRRERNDLLLGDQLTQVRKLTGLDCGVDAAWAEAVLHKVGPRVEELQVSNADLQHLRAIKGMTRLKKLHLVSFNLAADADVPLLPLRLEGLILEEFTRRHLSCLKYMLPLRNLYLTGSGDIPFTFRPMLAHRGIRVMTVCLLNTETLLSLVRAHAATLETLHVGVGSSKAHCLWRPNFSRRLHECGLAALTLLTLIRTPCQHDEPSCRVQMRAFRERFGPNVEVQCSECDED